MAAQPGWYDDADGHIRWWDGQGWTDHVRDREELERADRQQGQFRGGLANGLARVASGVGSAVQAIDGNRNREGVTTDVNGPVYRFVSHIEGKNATVEVYTDRIEWERKTGVSAAKITAGVLTAGMSLAVTGVGKGSYGASARDGIEVIRLNQVSGVSSKRDGMTYSVVSVSTPSMVIHMRTRHAEAAQAVRVLNDLCSKVARGTEGDTPRAQGQSNNQVVNVTVNAPAMTGEADTPQGAETDPVAQLKQITALRDAGILTEEEWAAKKAEILSRL